VDDGSESVLDGLRKHGFVSTSEFMDVDIQL
jgi:hypothetical protein